MSLSNAGKVKLGFILTKWSKALKHASDEHGRPNSFGVRELAIEYNLNPVDGYRIGTTRLPDLWGFLGGHEGWGSKPTYKRGWFHV